MSRPLGVLVAALTLPGCGDGSEDGGLLERRDRETSSRPAAVIRGWADSLRAGDVDAAADRFALPALVANGTAPVRLRQRAQLRAFNVDLPCGARLLRTRAREGYVIATFRLTDRRGPGAMRPCQGKGAEAATAFRIRDGRIHEWRRVPLPDDALPSMGTET